jgi:hypothetical protein
MFLLSPGMASLANDCIVNSMTGSVPVRFKRVPSTAHRGDRKRDEGHRIIPVPLVDSPGWSDF